MKKQKPTHSKRNKDRADDQTTMTVSMPETLKERIQKAADAEKRKKSNWLVKVLTDILDEEDRRKGIKPNQPDSSK